MTVDESIPEDESHSPSPADEAVPVAFCSRETAGDVDLSSERPALSARLPERGFRFFGVVRATFRLCACVRESVCERKRHMTFYVLKCVGFITWEVAIHSVRFI